MKWQRARSEEQKEYRISEIVNATARLYKKHSFDQISFSLIAKEAGFTRSNLYKYFSSKEEIFLEFLIQDTHRWRADLLKTCRRSKIKSIEQFAPLWVKTIIKHNRFLDLLSLLPTFLEKNVTEQKLVDFKRNIVNESEMLSEFLCEIFPALSPQQAGEFLELQLASVIGLYQITNLSEVQQKVLEYPEFRHMKIDFNTYLQKLVEHLLKGFIQ
jgi:TetR/AcrR family transcriptional regulator